MSCGQKFVNVWLTDSEVTDMLSVKEREENIVQKVCRSEGGCIFAADILLCCFAGDTRDVRD